MKWLNEPPEWRDENGTLHVITGSGGDFWRTTHYGFIHNNGHFAYEEHSGEFTATVHFEAAYKNLYDQAGLMIRISDEEWIKAGIEFFEGKMHLSVVVTHGTSDWSMQTWEEGPFVWLRLIRKGNSVAVESSPDGKGWRIVRLAAFTPDVPVMVGPMTCSPKGGGMHVRFAGFGIGPVVDFHA